MLICWRNYFKVASLEEALKNQVFCFEICGVNDEIYLTLNAMHIRSSVLINGIVSCGM